MRQHEATWAVEAKKGKRQCKKAKTGRKPYAVRQDVSKSKPLEAHVNLLEV